MNIIDIITESKKHPTDLVSWLRNSFTQGQQSQLIKEIHTIKPNHHLYRNALVVLCVMYYKGIGCDSNPKIGYALKKGALSDNGNFSQDLVHKNKKNNVFFQEIEYRQQEECDENRSLYSDPHLQKVSDNDSSSYFMSRKNPVKSIIEKHALERHHKRLRQADIIKGFEDQRMKLLKEQLSFLSKQLEFALNDNQAHADDLNSDTPNTHPS